MVRDHPRVCGEHEELTCLFPTEKGSSPRVRGTLVPGSVLCRVPGIIPACAGNTQTGEIYTPNTEDHPRVCGEHVSTWLCRLFWLGSSPRVRGTLCGIVTYCPNSGIIPACAGNTCCKTVYTHIFRDHPRVCGEHLACLLTNTWTQGSSPRVRGTLLRGYPRSREAGIIPACAGNTLSFLYAFGGYGDHPRVCGEHSRSW